MRQHVAPAFPPAVQIKTLVHNDKPIRIEHFFRPTGSVDRVLKIDSIRLQNKLDTPRRTVLEPLTQVSIEEALVRSRKELDDLLGGILPPMPKTKTIGGELSGKIVTLSAPEKKTTNSADTKGDPEVVRVGKKTVLQGEFVSKGEDERQGGGKKYIQYYLDIRVDELGIVQRVWGTDLARAIEAAGVQPGDRIKVYSPGCIPVQVPVKRRDDQGTIIEETLSVRKKAYHIAKL